MWRSSLLIFRLKRQTPHLREPLGLDALYLFSPGLNLWIARHSMEGTALRCFV